MLKMLQSASRFVLLLMTLTICAAFLLGQLDDKDFLILAGMVFAFYFTKTDKNTDPDFKGSEENN
jgi:hypothetical protein